MKTKRILWILFFIVAIVMAILIISVISEGAQAVPLTERDLGRAPLLGPSAIETKQDLYERIVVHRSRILNSIELGKQGKVVTAERVDVRKHSDLIEQAVKADVGVRETELPIGATILWMGWHSKVSNSEQVLRNRIWQGKSPLPGFEITIQNEGQEFKYFIPKNCGNLTLIEVKSLPSPTPKAEAPPPPPPSEYREYQYYVDVVPPPPLYYEWDIILPWVLPPHPFIFYGGSYGYHHYRPRYHYGGYYGRHHHYRPSPPRHYSPPRIQTRPPAVRPPGVRTR